LQAISRRQAPTWRIEYVNQFALLATLALGLSLLLGASRFGWTNWALINRFAGWFVLLAYATTGALITSTGGMRAVRSLAMSYAGATAGVVLVELTLLLLNALGFDVGSYVNLNQLQAFAQNHNFFAFQILMASGVVLVIDSGAYKKILLGIFLSGLWFAGSRSGWVSIVCMFVTALYLRRIDKRDLITAAGSAAALACLIFFLPVLEFHVWHLIYSFVGILHDWYGTSQSAASVFVRAPLSVAPQLVPTEASSSERMVTLIGGWKMFVDCPIFGAGLGAFRNLNILATSGIPLVIHSTALWLLAELGLVGFLIFAVPAIYVWVKEWRLAATDPAAAVIVLCFVGLAVMSGPADMLYQRTFWLIIGAALAVPRLSANNREQARATLRG
jgi:hypothetical protein